MNLRNIILAFAGKVLLKPTNLELKKNKRYGVVGQNWAWKTTLINRIASKDIIGFPEAVKVVFVRHEILSQSNDTVIEYAKKPAAVGNNNSSDNNNNSEEECLLEVGFDEKMMQKKVNELSGGWRMRLAIASAMTQNADLLLLDEPTNHLDVDAV